MRRRALLFGMMLAACGPGNGNSPGSGSNTLRVDAEASASESVNNASAASDFSTELSVRVSKGGAPVTGATVTIRSSCGEVALTDEMSTGTYRATQPSYCQTYTLEVTSGADRVAGVTVQGPAIHTISAPTERQNVSSRMALGIAWAPRGASETRIESRDYSTTLMGDPGASEIPMGRLRFEPGTATNERVRVTRSNSVQPAGAVTGSSFTVRIRNEVEFFTTS